MLPFLRKSFSSVSSPILACSDFTSTGGWDIALPLPEHSSHGALKLRLPRGHLIGMDVKLLSNLRHRSIALDCGKRHCVFQPIVITDSRPS
ncbi:hypothetical protein IVB06_36315 [Bradyrhizobium sp. 171]|nr:hypothetical protein [Bradyrhizobium sp. 176]MCK1561644.1 hypothetical protein [Bradyrhizobium sp. 171]